MERQLPFILGERKARVFRACACRVINEGSHQLVLEREVVSYSLKGNVLMCGDKNARTGTLMDYIENDAGLSVDTPLNYTIEY